MEFSSQGQVLEVLLNAVPYPNQIKNIDLSYDKAVYFTWRSSRFKVELSTGSVDVSEGQMLIGNDVAILLRELMQRTLINLVINNKNQ